MCFAVEKFFGGGSRAVEHCDTKPVIAHIEHQVLAHHRQTD